MNHSDVYIKSGREGGYRRGKGGEVAGGSVCSCPHQRADQPILFSLSRYTCPHQRADQPILFFLPGIPALTSMLTTPSSTLLQVYLPSPACWPTHPLLPSRYTCPHQRADQPILFSLPGIPVLTSVLTNPSSSPFQVYLSSPACWPTHPLHPSRYTCPHQRADQPILLTSSPFQLHPGGALCKGATSSVEQ